jgi:hypothetical protein
VPWLVGLGQGVYRVITSADGVRHVRPGVPASRADVPQRVVRGAAGGALVGNFALDDDGSFVIAGLTPGFYVLRIEPLDDGDVESFFDRSDLDVDFAVTFHDRIVVVPRGGTSSRIAIAVRPR